MRPEDVPAGPLLVDTDVLSYWVIGAGNGEAFKPLTRGHELAVSFATWGELPANVHRLRWGPRRMNELRNNFGSIANAFSDLRIVHPDL